MKVAVIGTGSIGSRHLGLLKKIEGVETVAISKRKENYEELQGASYCIIASNTICHMEDALCALDEGCQLLIEKPLATCVEEAHPLILKSKEKNKKIMIGCVLRFSESLNQFRRLLPQIGAAYSVRIECQSYLPDWRPNRPYQESYSSKSNEGGVLRDLIHEIDYTAWIFGWPRSLSARLKNTGILGIASEEIADLWWESPDGTLVSITLDYLTQPSRRKMMAYGRLGTLEWDGIKGEVILTLNGKEPKLLRFVQSQDEMYSEQLKTFLGLIDGYYEPATLEDGLKTLSICDAARLSSKNSRMESFV